MYFINESPKIEIAFLKNTFFAIHIKLLESNISVDELLEIFDEEILYSKGNCTVSHLKNLILEYGDEKWNNELKTLDEILKNF